MMAQGPDLVATPQKDTKTRAMGSRRIFPPLFKIQVLESYRNDRDCKGNQRATARKFNIHRRQIQKWLQCETSLRSQVAETIRQGGGNQVEPAMDPSASPERRGPRVFKHDARTLKLVAQRLYPSSFPGAIKDDQCTSAYLVAKDFANESSMAVSGHKLNITDSSLYLKDNVSEPSELLQKYSGRSDMVEPSSLNRGYYLPPHPPMYAPSLHIPRPVCPLPRPMPVHASVSPALPTSDEPYNLVKSPARPTSPCSSSEMTSREGSPAVPAASSPLPSRVCEITAETKTSAFSPKRKWLQESMNEKLLTESAQTVATQSPPVCEPKAKKPCPDFSIERLCGRASPVIKCEARTPPSQPPSPCVFSPYSHPMFPLPPPLLLPHRTIPHLMSLHFKPEQSCASPESSIKEESMSDDEEDEQIDVLSTTPVEKKTFEFPGGKRRSFSVQFKLDVLDAFYNDKDCNKNQRATARKFNINRRQVQKWLSQESGLRSEVAGKQEGEMCSQCPQHCATVSVKHCMDRQCFLSDLKQEKPLYPWATASALPYLPWYTPTHVYDCNIY